jgi:predicted dehydrogenase
MMVHKVDLALWLLGDLPTVQTLFSDTLLHWRNISGERVEASAEDCVLLELGRDGLTVLCESDMVTGSYMNYVEIVGRQGSIFTSILEYLPTVLHCKEAWGGVYSQGNNFFHFPVVNLFERELGEFVSAVRRQDRTLQSLEDSMRVARILEATRTVPQASYLDVAAFRS